MGIPGRGHAQTLSVRGRELSTALETNEDEFGRMKQWNPDKEKTLSLYSRRSERTEFIARANQKRDFTSRPTCQKLERK